MFGNQRIFAIGRHNNRYKGGISSYSGSENFFFNIFYKRGLEKLPFVTPRELTSITGKIVSMSLVLGNITKLMTKYLYSSVECKLGWDTTMNISKHPGTLMELKFWLDNVSRLNYKILISYETPKVVSYSDASTFACGAIMLSCDNAVAHRMWSQEERDTSFFVAY